jgi:hypothetical protein
MTRPVPFTVSATAGARREAGQDNGLAQTQRQKNNAAAKAAGVMGTVYWRTGKKPTGPPRWTTTIDPGTGQGGGSSQGRMAQSFEWGYITDQGARGVAILGRNPQRVLAAIRAAGIPVSSMDDVQNIWIDAMNESARLYAKGKYVNPWDALKRLGRQGEKAGMPGYGQPFTGSKTTTSTNTGTQVNLASPGEAERLLNETLRNELGREATAAEVRQFRGALNSKARKDPSTSTSRNVTTTNYVKGESTGSNTTSTSTSDPGFSGADQVQFAEDEARAEDGWAEYQAATTYYDAFLSAIQSPGATGDRKSTRLNSSHHQVSRMPSSA